VTDSTGCRLSVSTWCLHRTLGRPDMYGVEAGFHIPTATHGRGTLSLLELPARLATFGIRTLELCHFHLPSLDPGYLAELQAELQAAQVELFSLLIDDGDIIHPTHAERDLAWIRRWIEIADTLGAKHMRVIAGKSAPTQEDLTKSAQELKRLAILVEEAGMRLMTENWFGVLSTPAAVHELFEQLEDQVGLCLDFGNWNGPGKYRDLREIATYAESCHAKAHFSGPDELDVADYTQCLEITAAANFAGPYTLIYSGPDDDEWAGLAREMQIVQPYLSTRVC
jgi:sugar phosphate isomerase/epimerase